MAIGLSCATAHRIRIVTLRSETAAQACEFDFAKSFRQCLLPNLGILAHTKRIRRKLASFEFKCKMHEMLTYCAHQAQCKEPEGTLHMKEDA